MLNRYRGWVRYIHAYILHMKNKRLDTNRFTLIKLRKICIQNNAMVN